MLFFNKTFLYALPLFMLLSLRFGKMFNSWGDTGNTFHNVILE